MTRSRMLQRPLPFLIVAAGLTALVSGLVAWGAGPSALAASGQEKAAEAEEEEENGGDIVFHVQSRLQPNSAFFSHEAHLAADIDCDECHEDIFKKELGANRFRMKDVNKGQFCGVCHQDDPPENVHGSFAPKKNCAKCHSLRVRPLAQKTGR